MALRGLWHVGAAKPPLVEFAQAHGTAKAGWGHGEERMATYEHLLAPRRREPITLVEIGVLRGDSLRLWRAYLPNARIIGVDVNEEVRALRIPGVEIRIGDQSDTAFLAGLVAAAPLIDVVIDDGGHRAEQQLTSLLHLWPHLAPGGIYAVEDTETSYMPKYDMSWRAEGTTMEVLKGLADDLHARWHDQPVLLQDVASVSFQPSLCIIRKAPHPRPRSLRDRIRRAAIRSAVRRDAACGDADAF